MTPITGLIPGALISHLNITARHSAEQQLRQDALHNSLTGLAHRAPLLDRLTQALTADPDRSENPDVKQLLQNLVQFKTLNDAYRHPVADQVLPVIARG